VDLGGAAGVLIGAAIGVAVVGVVFFGVVGSLFTADRLREALDAASWVAVVGFALCSVATLFLPSRSAVRAHAEREKALASA
jgi:membrane protein implicated in regulation of membrane protease activity